MKTTAEVIIVGGGVVGNAAAYYLAKRGVEVIVLEGSDSIGMEDPAGMAVVSDSLDEM